MTEPGSSDVPEWFQGPDADRLLGSGKNRFLPAQSTLCAEGEILDRFFLVVSGEFEIAKHIAGRHCALSICGPGTVLALMPALDGEPCAVSIRAYVDASVVEIKREALLGLLEQPPEAIPEIANRLSLLAIRRLRSATDELAQALHCAIRSPGQRGRVDAGKLALIQAHGYAWLDF
jgi:CRP-like cAMP-binding protein